MELKRKRKEVVASVSEAASLIKDGMTIAIGGFGTVNHPMAVIREIVRNGVTSLTVIGAATGGLDIDMLIGAGCARKVIAPYVGAELLCPIGHCFRRAAERKEIEVWECSEYILYAGLFAGASGQDFMAWRGGVGSSIPDLNKDLKEFPDPIGGKKKYLAVPALRADWALIQVGWADPYGNGQHLGAPFGDRWLARAADRIMLVAERIVPNNFVRKNPFMTSISYADCVVEAPYGSHPFAAHGFYREDVEHILEYVRASEEYRRNSPQLLQEYLARYVYEPKDHMEYLERVGVRKLLGLYTPPIVTW